MRDRDRAGAAEACRSSSWVGRCCSSRLAFRAKSRSPRSESADVPVPEEPAAPPRRLARTPRERDARRAARARDRVRPHRPGRPVARAATSSTACKSLRRKLALELGVVIPLVRTRDNLELPASTYSIRVHGVDVGRGEAPPGHVLVLGDDSTGALPGIQTREPVFGLPGDVGAARVPAPGRGHRRDGRRSRVGHHDAPRRSRAPQRGPAPRSPGREAAARRREAERSRRHRRVERRQRHAPARSTGSCRSCSTKASGSATSCGSSK